LIKGRLLKQSYARHFEFK